jgi:hypothetical protein
MGMNMTWTRLVVGAVAALALLFLLYLILNVAGHSGS